MGFEGLGDLMRSRCLSQETPKPRRRCDAGRIICHPAIKNDSSAIL
jgi:hypothetical protein